MRHYLCKVFTKEFREALDIEISKEMDTMMNQAEIPEEHRHLHTNLLYKQIMRNFRNMWTEPAHYEMKFPDTVNYYKSVGLWTPEFDLLHLQAMETEFQKQARVQWNGEILRIDDVEEIYSYTVVMNYKPGTLKEKLMHHRV